LNEVFSQQTPWLVEAVLKYALYHTYADIEAACKLLEQAHSEGPELLDYIFVDTAAVHDADGTTRTGYKLTLTSPLTPAISYADTGGKGVDIAATGAVKQTWSTNAYYIAMGLKGRIFG
jgi:hypothetical protein